jgi:hypothetical protein
VSGFHRTKLTTVGYSSSGGAAKKNLDHSKFDASEIDLRTVRMKGSPRRDVDSKIVGHDGGRYFRFAHSAKRCSHPSQKLLYDNRLGDVIVSTCVERSNEGTIALSL